MSEILWRCPYNVYTHFLGCLNLLSGMTEGTDDYKAVVEEIRSLPGYPNDYDTDRDSIVPEPYREYLL